MSNANGNYRTTVKNDLKAFEQLPRDIRDLINESGTKWACRPIVTQFKRLLQHFGPQTAIIEMIKRIERWNSEEREDHYYRLARMERGVDYNAPIRRRRTTQS